MAGSWGSTVGPISRAAKSGSRYRGAVSDPIRPARPSDVAAIAQAMARAMVDDPIEKWTCACRDLERVVTAEFAELDRQALARGQLWAIDGVPGGAVWVAPGTVYDDDSMRAVVSPLLTSLGGDVARYDGFWAWVERHRPAEPHLYLDILAIDPTQQHRGAGGALLRHGLARADEMTVPTFLIAANAANVAWYLTSGFVIRALEPAAGGGPPVWFMERAPGSP